MRIGDRKGAFAKAIGRIEMIEVNIIMYKRALFPQGTMLLVFGKHIGALMRHISPRQSHRNIGASNEESENNCILI